MVMVPIVVSKRESLPCFWRGIFVPLFQQLYSSVIRQYDAWAQNANNTDIFL